MSKPRATLLPWVCALGALIGVVVVLVVTRGALEILLVAAIIVLLAVSYLLRHFSRRHLFHGRRD